MKTPVLIVVLAALVLVPALVAEEATVQVAQAVDGQAAVAVDPVGSETAAAGTSVQQALPGLFTAPLFQAGVTAQTRYCITQCPGGETISCNTSECSSAELCGVFCQGHFYRCISGCL